MAPIPSPARVRRNRMLVIGCAIGGLALAGFAPRNQRALFLTDGGPGEQQAYFLAPDTPLVRLGFPGVRNAIASPLSRGGIPRAAPVAPPPVIQPSFFAPAAPPFAVPVEPFVPVATPGSPALFVPPLGLPPTLIPGVPTIILPPTAGPTPPDTIDTPPAGAVPEPATWATMIGGLLSIGVMLRARRGKPAAA